MSFYPLEYARLTKLPTNRVVADTFDDGGSSTRRLWTAQYFRRRFEIEHMPLTLAEWQYLRSFYSQRSGRSDSFYFRDNAERKGNFLVRFAQDLPVTITPAQMRQVRVLLEETAATRELPEIDEIYTAAGSEWPLFFYDANRMRYYTHAGTAYTESGIHDVRDAYALTAPGDAPVLSGYDSSLANYWAFTGTRYAISGSNVTLSGTQPALTLFCQVYSQPANGVTDELLLQVGNHGLVLNTSNDFTPWLSAGGTWTNAKSSNGVGAQWRSVAAVWTGSSNTGALYVNGASIGSDSNTRSYTADVVSLGAAGDGSITLDGGRLQNVMAFNKALSLAQIKALHNLFAYQFSLAEVA